MLFSEPIFFVFFAIYFLLHVSLPADRRIFLVIVGSTVFYAWWRVDYVWLPYLLTGLAWGGVLWMDDAGDQSGRKARFIVTIIALFTPLVLVKYSFFFANDVLGLLPASRAIVDDLSMFKLALPLGISFITFTLTAYVVDVYRGRYRAEHRLTVLLGYVLFFPHLIAGPILRPHELMPQLRQIRAALDARFTLGLALFSIGLTKKLVFADTIAMTVDDVFRVGASPTSWEYLLAIYGFSMQIYCDFSGYTDMAIGLAFLLRIRLPTNFLRPYGSASIIEFWRRWHITLSHWLRDYLYIPLGGSRRGKFRQYSNLLITMVLGGLWHGAAWTFVIWGALHGLALAAVHVARQVAPRLLSFVPRWLGVLLTFHFVTLAWVYFRAPNIETAHRIFGGLWSFSSAGFADFFQQHIFPILLLGVFALTHRFDRHARVRLAVKRWNKGVIWSLIGTMFVLAIAVSQGNSGKFIYFDF